MYAASTERYRRAVYFRGTIGCNNCGRAIHVHKVAGLADEFSLCCSHCGTRRFYDKRLMAVEEMPERRRKPRR